MANNIDVSFVLDEEQKKVLERAFPGKPDYQEVAKKISVFITNEFIDLLAGKKRYLSLSHQYIEWIQSVYEILLPDEEYTYQVFSDRFNFPPGTASYMARVLRSRQNSTLHNKAIKNLKIKLEKEKEIFDGLPQDKKVNQTNRLLKLALREVDILQMLIDDLYRKDQPVDQPKLTSSSKEFANISVDIQSINKILPEFSNYLKE